MVTVGMQKGGVSKTTNCIHLATALAERGKRVLLWDIDENHGATKVFGVNPEGFQTTWNVLVGDITIRDAICEWDDEEGDVDLPENFDFIPSSRKLEKLDMRLSEQDKLYNPNDVLKPHVHELREMNRYDYIFLDTGPTASPTVRGALMSSEFYILSCIAERLCMDSLPEAIADIKNARRVDRNPNLKLLGLILSQMDRRKNLAKTYEAEIQEKMKTSDNKSIKFASSIGSAADIEKAYRQYQTLFQYKPGHVVCQQYRELAEEFEERVGYEFYERDLKKRQAETEKEERQLANA